MGSTTTYEAWARAFHGHAHLRRSAERNAAFVLPRLESGQRLIDIGCGPGTITTGLATRVAPGEVVGVDLDADRVAPAASRSSSSPNIRFQQADACALPFDDDAFDVSFSHAVLQHVESPAAVLREVRRVVRPGGLVAVADADLDGFLLHPQTDALRAACALDRRTRRNPDVGRRLPELLIEAGFADVELSIAPSVVTGAAATSAVAASTAGRLEAPPFVDHAVAQGWVADADELRAMADAWRTWGAAPGATFVTLWCQALGQ